MSKPLSNKKLFDVVGLGSCTMDIIFEVDDINIEENPADLAMIIEKVNAQLHGLF